MPIVRVDSCEKKFFGQSYRSWVSTLPVAFAMSSAIFTNLGLLTADIYALFIGLYLGFPNENNDTAFC